jgi:hypothetical protein
MDIERLKERIRGIGCEIVEDKTFSVTAKCGDDVFLVKSPDSRLKVLAKPANIDEISAVLQHPKNVAPREITIGKFNKQGSWSRVLKLGDMDEVEYYYGEDEIRAISSKVVKESIARIDRANKFAYMANHEGIEPVSVVKKELDKISDFLTGHVESSIADKAGDVICGNKQSINKSWNRAENDRYRFSVKVNCKVPGITGKVLSKIESIGSWRTMSESDRFYVKSIMPNKDVLLTGVKVKSPFGENQFEFELVDDDRVGKKNFLESIRNIRETTVSNKEEGPVDVQKIVDSITRPDTA